MAQIVDVQPKDICTVKLSYNDGLTGDINLVKAIERNNFYELKNNSEFEKVYVDQITNELCWPSGVRMCGNALHKQLSLLCLMNRLKINLDND
ncbi:MAG: DUF2442 domain-containing protein [Melioribacteraceae bacterium]|nr:MAG: DUF2442 domain-containing protein [Ignavibacteriales bacterium]WKZ70397.1 MAG: DUF2442 domain-containing protein [Melioribacteraceae bacterium]